MEMDDSNKEEKDSLVEDVFSTLERISELRLQLDNVVGDGFFQMAQARKAFGASNIGALQFDLREALPLRRVDICQNSRKEAEFHLISTPPCRMKNNRKPAEDEDAAEGKASECVEEIGSLNLGTGDTSCEDHAATPNRTKRKGEPTSDGAGSDETNSDEGTEQKAERTAHETEQNPETIPKGEKDKKICGEDVRRGEESSGVCNDGVRQRGHGLSEARENTVGAKRAADPLHWFGVLVPLSLRESQKSFQRALTVLCKLGEEQAQLEVLRTRYSSLK